MPKTTRKVPAPITKREVPIVLRTVRAFRDGDLDFSEYGCAKSSLVNHVNAALGAEKRGMRQAGTR